MEQRASYHTTIKELTHYGLLPPKYEKTIPRTNIHRWKHDLNIKRFVGSEINQIADKHTDLIKTLNEYPKMFYAYGRLVKTVINVVEKAQDYKKLVKDSKEDIVKAINRVRGYIPVEKAVKLFNITRSTFYIWSSDVLHKCEKSYFNRCNRIYSNQVTPMEIEAVKERLSDPATEHWSMRSVYFKGIRDGGISVSLGTMYMINRRLKIRDTIGKRRKKRKYKTGIRANEPNQIWHADITILKTADGVKHYIYLLIDNFSRKILSYEVRNKVSGLVTLTTIEGAYKKARIINENLNVKLIVDGGTENNNVYVENFINRSEINMEKLIAPHGQLKGLTPDEAWRGVKSIDNHRIKVLTQAKKERLEFNRVNTCSRCIQ